MIVLDTSAWIQGWKEPASVAQVDAEIARLGGDPGQVLVPSTVVFEATRWLIRHLDDEEVIAEHAASMDAQEQLPIDAAIARRAAFFSVTTGLGHADAMILAASRSRHATLLTYDADFEGVPDAVVLRR